MPEIQPQYLGFRLLNKYNVAIQMLFAVLCLSLQMPAVKSHHFLLIVLAGCLCTHSRRFHDRTNKSCQLKQNLCHETKKYTRAKILPVKNNPSCSKFLCLRGCYISPCCLHHFQPDVNLTPKTHPFHFQLTKKITEPFL